MFVCYPSESAAFVSLLLEVFSPLKADLYENGQNKTNLFVFRFV